jgi:uncharacterized membrane protein
VAALVVIHVLAAVIGVGPTYFFPALLRPTLAPSELGSTLAIGRRLARYPQIGGPIALLSGIGLVCAIDTHLFAQTWIIASFAIFVAIQAVIMTMAVPATKKLEAWMASPGNADAKAFPPDAQALYQRLRTAHIVAAALGTVLFGLMIVKPV